MKLPKIAENSNLTEHLLIAAENRRNVDSRGIDDPLGVNQIFMGILKDFLDDEEIKRTHREPVTEGSEELKLQEKRDKWFAVYEDILRSPPAELPPWREVNHKIPLIDKVLQYRY